jgi:hypothetical protein
VLVQCPQIRPGENDAVAVDYKELRTHVVRIYALNKERASLESSGVQELQKFRMRRVGLNGRAKLGPSRGWSVVGSDGASPYPEPPPYLEPRPATQRLQIDY